MLSGDNSILSRAGQAKERTAEEQLREEIQIAILGVMSENSGTLNKESLETGLKGINGATVSYDETSKKFTVTKDGYMFTVDLNGNIVSAKGIALNKNNLKLLAGGSETLTVSYLGNTSGNVTWSSNNEKITVSNGKVEVASDATGTAKITATCGSYTATCDVAIVQKINSISAAAISVGQGQTKQIVVTTNPTENVEDITYSYEVTANTSNASVDSTTGIVTGTTIGSATVTITGTTASGETKTTTCAITVTERQARILDDVYTGITWTTLSTMAKDISNDSSINSNTEEVTKTVGGKTYTIAVGDIKRITIGEETYQAEILGFKHDDLANATNEGYTAGLTKAGISFQLKELMTTTKNMNSIDTNKDGWAATNVMYSYLNTTVYGDLETATKNAIVTVGKKYMAKYDAKTVTADTVKTSNDKLWLLSCSEIWSDGVSYTDENSNSKTGYGYAYLQELEQYKYYKNATNNKSYSYSNTKLVKKNLTGTANYWWLRSPDYDDYSNFCGVNSNGLAGSSYAGSNGGVAFGFSI